MITEIKNSFSSRLFIAEERSSELENRSKEIMQNVMASDKEMKNVESVRDRGYSQKI